MDVSAILDPLNEAQRAAVCSPAKHTLIIAGAGSGKTRVLIHRIAWLCQLENITPYDIVAVTFTNKAAREMRERTESLLGGVSLRSMWLGTFHGLCHRLLRRHWEAADLPQGFQIIDAQDQKRIIKRAIANLNMDEEKWPPRKVQWFINARKDEGVRPEHIQDTGDYSTKNMVRIYSLYEDTCRNSGLVDFGELLLRTVELLRDNAELRTHYHERFRAILVDEFQDTNSLQYAWLQTLSGPEISTFVVGDDDQSIYSWRGARIENIRNFENDFHNAEIYRLERNYRSSPTILSAANALIGKNRGRLGKKLWTDRDGGEPILVFRAVNEREEAQFVAGQIQQWLGADKSRDEIAVLYRSNAQSRALEEALLIHGIPYRVYGGVRFFERAVIKDVLAYLRLAQNLGDDQSFERIINTPPRGIGDKTVTMIRELAQARHLSLWSAGRCMLDENLVSARALNALQVFYVLLAKIVDARDLPLPKLAEQVIDLSDLKTYYGRVNDEKARSNMENLDEFINAADEFKSNLLEDEDNLSPLDAFLAHTALEAGETQNDSDDVSTYVQLMTLHAAKGLEFPCVIMVGMEEGLFPHAMSLEEPGRLEEERRLCYVGITRAREYLTMSYAETRRLYYGQEMRNTLSRFIKEIPAELLNEIRPRLQISQPFTHKTDTVTNTVTNDDSSASVHVGRRVKHNKFGEGIVLDKEGAGASERVQVRFESAGIKWLVTSYARLQVL